MNNHDKTVRGLTALGYVVDPKKRGHKYEAYYKPGEEPRRYFVGKTSLRVSSQGIVGDSISLTGNPWHEAVMEVGKDSKNYPTPELAAQAVLVIRKRIIQEAKGKTDGESSPTGTGS